MRNPICSLAALPLLVTLFASDAPAAGSRYSPLLASTSGQDTLRDLALWEDQRVPGDGQLFVYLAEGSPLVRIRALEVIGRIQEPADAAQVLPRLAEKRIEVLREAVFTLGQLGNREAVAPLIALRASTADPELHSLIAESLGKLGGDEAIVCLMEMLRDFNTRVRADAALALWRCKDPGAANALLLAVHDPDPGVQWRAIYSLETQETLPRTCETVTTFLESRDPLVRAYAARTLGKRSCTNAGKALVARLGDDDERVVINAARALGDIKFKDAAAPLGSLIRKHGSMHVRTQAAMALEKIAEKASRDDLMLGLMDRSVMVRIHSLRALAVVMGNKSEMYIDQMAHDGSRLVRAEALRCYGMAGITTRLKTLEKIVHDDKDPMMRAAAVTALGQLKDPAVGPLLVPAVRDPDFTVASAAAEAIGEQKYAAGIPALIEMCDLRGEREFVDLQLAAIPVLADLKAAQADSLLFRATRHDDRRVREAAVAALQKMGLTPPVLPTEREINQSNFDRTRRKQLAPPVGIVRATITTDHGPVEVELFGDDAIQTVANFVRLAKEGFYKGLTTHRVVPNFVVQGGDPRGDGSGDAGFTVPAEVSRHRYDAGYLGVADAGKDTGSSQWFITLSPQPHLSGRYTIFGRVTKGMEAVWKMDQGDKFNVKPAE